MSSEDKMVLWFAVAFAIFVVALVTMAVFSDVENWERTEDPNCYLRIHDVNQMFGPDSVTRERYCRE